MFVIIARLFRTYPARQVNLVDGYIVHEPLILNSERHGKRMKRGLDEVCKGKGRACAAHWDIWRDQNKLAIII